MANFGVIGSEYQDQNQNLLLRSNDSELRNAISAVYSRGAHAVRTRTVTATEELDPRFSVILCDTTGGGITITLPYANYWGDDRSPKLTFIHIAGSADVVIDGKGSDTIGGSGTYSLSAGSRISLVTDGETKWYTFAAGIISSSFKSVFDYMTSAQIADVLARTFLVDVSGALEDAFDAGVGNMPAGGYYCAAAISVAEANRLTVRGEDGSSEVEMRFATGVDGLTLTYSDPLHAPNVLGVTITTLKTGAAVSGTGLKIVMDAMEASHWRHGPIIDDVVVRGSTTTSHGWSTCIHLENLWYPIVHKTTCKGYSAAGAVLNTYDTLYGLYMKKVMGPFIDTITCYHINTPIYDDTPRDAGGTDFAVEGALINNFEIVGCRTGINLGVNQQEPQPGTTIGRGHINSSYRGILAKQRVQTSFTNLSLYRTDGATEAWVGIELDNCENCFIDNVFFGYNSAAVDITTGRGIKLSGSTSNSIIGQLISNEWNAAGFFVELAGTASRNIIKSNSFKAGPDGTLWGKLTYTGTGTENRIWDEEGSITAFSANDATPSVKPESGPTHVFQTANNVSTTITDFDDGYAGQIIQVLINDSNTTIQNDGTNIALNSGANKVCFNGDIFTFRNYGNGLWREIAYTSKVTHGDGFKFPATQVSNSDVNILDDYEEGTWTPALTFATPGDLSVVYANRNGQYTKIGRQVTVSFLIETSTFTHTTASGAANITGLPFTSANISGSAYNGGMAFTGITMATYTNFICQIGSNTAIATIVASGTGVTAAQVTATNMASGTNQVIRASITYFTAT